MLSKKLLLILLFALPAMPTLGQPAETTPEAEAEEAVQPDETKEVGVQPLAEDDEIAARLKRIMEATDWFVSPEVEVEEGVVFLRGRTDTEKHREWAGNLASRTQDVVAVVNKVRVDQPDLLDFSPAIAEVEDITRTIVHSTPVMLVGIVLLLLTWLASKIAVRLFRFLAEQRFKNRLLSGVIARAATLPVVLIGIYLTLKVTGLTRLAATFVGGTGLLGLVVGIAFRDIAENFLASILISIQRPFRAGDLVKIGDHTGFVQSVTTRGTSLMTFDGNHIQVPNATIYKSIIENYSTNPNVRLSFAVGIDYEDSATDAQQAILDTLKQHQAVLAEPEPMILVDELAASTVNLIVYFWVDEDKHSGVKVRSALMRQVKQVLLEKGLTLPDEAREVIFPRGIPVRMVEEQPKSQSDSPAKPPNQQEQQCSAAEGDLTSEKEEIQKQASQSRQLEDDATNLLDDEQPAEELPE